MEYHDLLEVDEPEPPPTLTPLEESEARAASLKTEMHIARNKVNALNAELRSEKAAHFETNKQLVSLQAFQAELDDKDGADRASRAGLMYRLREKDEALLEQAKKFAQEQKNAERAKLSMHGLRAQLRSATDTIDGVRLSNEALLKPFRDEIAERDVRLEEITEALKLSRADTNKARKEAATATDNEQAAIAAKSTAEAAAVTAAKAQSIAESSFRDLEKRVEEAVAMEVAEGTRALASELDEAYDRSDELGKEVESLKVKVDVFHREAKASLASLEEAQLVSKGLETDKAELQATKARLLEQVRDLKKELASKTLMVQEMEVLVKEREDRISDLEGRADKLAKEVQRLCASQASDQNLIEHMQRILDARNQALEQMSEEVLAANHAKRDAVRRTKQAESAAKLLEEEAEERTHSHGAASAAAATRAQQQLSSLQAELDLAYKNLRTGGGAASKVLFSKGTQTSTDDGNDSKSKSPAVKEKTATAAPTETGPAVINLTLETPNNTAKSNQQDSPNAFPTTMPPLQSPPVALASPELLPTIITTSGNATAATNPATGTATADATATTNAPATANPASKNNQMSPSRSRRKSPKGRRSSPRNNTSSLSPARKEIASPSSSPAKRSDGMKQQQEQQQLLSRGGAGASRTMAEGRRVMVAHEVAAAKHREKGHLRQRAETIAREVLKEDQAQEALLRATAQANRQAKSEAQQQATLQHLRQKAEALVVLEPPHQRKNNTYLPHLSRKALGFEPPGEALRRPPEEIAASFRLSSSSSTRKDSAATPPIPLPAATTAQAGAAAPVHTEESGGAAVNTGSNESSGECKSAMPLQDPES